MELALELVNHVPREMADRLIDRLRGEEAARCAAEERCAEAEERISAALDVKDMRTLKAGKGRKCASAALFGVILLFVLASLCWFSRDFDYFTEGKQWITWLYSAHTREHVVTSAERWNDTGLVNSTPWDVDARAATVEQDSDWRRRHDGTPFMIDACDSMLREAREELHELRRHYGALQDGYRSVLEAVSEWLEFLRIVWGPSMGANNISMPSGPSSGSLVASLTTATSPHELEASCLVASEPGRRALEALLVSGVSLNGHEGVSMAAQLANRLSRLRRQPWQPLAPGPLPISSSSSSS